MAAETLAEKKTELAEVKAAISRTLNAQGYSQAGRSKTNPVLAELYKAKEKLIEEIESLEAGGDVGVRTIETLY